MQKAYPAPQSAYDGIEWISKLVIRENTVIHIIQWLKETGSNKPQPRWYKLRNPSNNKEISGQSTQHVLCSTANKIS